VRDVILLEGVQIPAALGVTAAERRMRRPVRLDVELERDLRAAGRSDKIANTIDYQRVYDAIERVAAGQDHRLVEALAERIAAALLAELPVEAVTVTVRKSRIRRERGA
jgi:dihydroneopterin aldolase